MSTGHRDRSGDLSWVALPTCPEECSLSDRVEQQAQRLSHGAAWPATGLVFTSTSGTPLEPRNVSREWDHLRREAGLPDLRLHDLRHSCATILVALGVHPRVVMETLRHSQIGITMDTYAHVKPLLQREAADALENALFG